MKDTDVIVAGAGPSGCAAAIALARDGCRVVLLERAPLPQYKTCGDALLADALRSLDDLGLGKEVRAAGLGLTRLEVTAPGGRRVSLAADSVTLQRPRLHALLQEKAQQMGVLLIHGEACSPLLAGEQVVGVQWRQGKKLLPLRAPLVVLATGARPDALRDFGVCLRERPTAVGIRAYFRDVSGEFDEALRVSFQRSLLPGYGWVFPLPDGIYNIGCGWFFTRENERQPDLRHMFDHFLCSFLPARAIALKEEMLGTPCGGVLRSGLCGARSHRGGLLVAGDALGATLAFTGEGVGKAMETGLLAARVAVEALQAGDFSPEFLGRFAAVLEQRYRSLYSGYDRAQRWLSRPRLADLLAWQAERKPAFRETLSGVLAEDLAPSAVFSVAGLLGLRHNPRPAAAPTAS